MSTGLSKEQEELVAVGAAIGANCEPCVRFHLRKASEAGLSEEQLRAAVAVAAKVKETPARLVLEAAERTLAPGGQAKQAAAGAGCCG
ncbi:MAG: carboxymuconolactone decarboxylase family protein [Deltaproteobacteria bacterium]|nr:carboxymuconolactone decarboxylase family protein [Deltaproteobacteria bacterium]